MTNTPDDATVFVPVSRQTLRELPADVSLTETIALWTALENPAEIVDGEEVGER